MGNEIQKEDLTQKVFAIAKAKYNTVISDNLTNLVPLLSSSSNAEHVDDIFRKFDYEQILFFSNNLCSFMKNVMSTNLSLINQTSSLLLLFTNSIYQKYLNIRELVLLQYHLLSEQKKPSKDIILTCFPYNLFLFAVESLCNDEFLIVKDVFQREVDKFDFIQKTSALMFLILNHIDYPITKNALSAIEYVDTVKLFLFPREVFLKQSQIKSLMIKLYNTSIQNFPNLLASRVDPNIPIDKFESFLYMNLSIFLDVCMDVNITLVPSVKDQLNPLVSNTFNQRSLQMCKAVYESADPIELVSEYNVVVNQIIKEELMLTVNEFRKFIAVFYANIDRLTVPFQVMVKMMMMFIFENNGDICEMLCLSTEILQVFMANMKFTNAFDLILLHYITQTQNFHLMAKHLSFSIEDICHECLTTLIDIRSSKKKLTYSSYYCLLIVLNLSSSFNDISPDTSDKLNEFYEHLIKTEVSVDNFFHTVLCVTIYFEIVFSLINKLEFPSNEIFRLIKINKERLKFQEIMTWFYQSNVDLLKRGKRLWENFNKANTRAEAFIAELNKRIISEGCDMNYSQDIVLKSIVNKFTFIKDTSTILSEEERKKSVFNSDVVKFLISTLHSSEQYSILI